MVTLDTSFFVLHYSKDSDVLKRSRNALRKEVVESGLDVVDLSTDAARESGVLRVKYQEKISWGDCLIAGTHLTEKADVVLCEDSHFKDIREISSRKLGEFRP